ncbi:MAG: NYN domain-containing protein [Paracoccaceae bacterium]
MDHRYAILIDGGFFSRKLHSKLGRRPKFEDVVAEIDALKTNPIFSDFELLRVYYYDAYPATGKIRHPVTGIETNLAETDIFRRNKSFLQRLELLPDVSLRAGDFSPRGYKLSYQALGDENLSKRALEESDFIPDIEQKGADLRIGLDIARLSLRQLARTIAVVTGDSDLIPAFKFARREGVRVVLAHMGHGVKRELKAHTDALIN